MSNELPPDRSRRLFVTAGSWLHKLETAYILITLVVTMASIVHSSRNMLDFAAVFCVLSLGAAGLALWPATPRYWAIFAEAFLLLLLIGQWLGPRTSILPILNREISHASDWNDLPLPERRTLVWNLVGLFGFAWLSVPYIMFVADRPKNWRQWCGRCAVLLTIWPALALLFGVVVVAFFSG
jgi:hypothetical protein